MKGDPKWEEGVSAPVCDWHSNPGAPPLIPWAVAVMAWQEYAHRYGGRYAQPLEQVCRRGGWYVSELDSMHPKWRDDVKARSEVRAALDAMRALVTPDQAAAFERLATALDGVPWPVSLKPVDSGNGGA